MAHFLTERPGVLCPEINCHIETLRKKAKAIGYKIKTERNKNISRYHIIFWRLIPISGVENYRMKELRLKLVADVKSPERIMDTNDYENN